MKLLIDIDKLHLPGPGSASAWKAPPGTRAADTDSARGALLELGFSAQEVDQLHRMAAGTQLALKIVDGWPTEGEDRKVIEALAAVVDALGLISQGLSPRAHAEIAAVSLQRFGDPNRISNLARELSQSRTLGHYLRSRAAALPAQTRRKPPTQLVRELATIAAGRLGTPTKWPESPFYKACVAMFTLAGRPTAPDRAIDRYLEGLGDRGKKRGPNRP